MKRYLSKFDLSLDFVKYSIYDCLNGTTSGRKRWKRSDTSIFIADYVEKLLNENNYTVTSRHKLEKKIQSIAKDNPENLYFIVDYIAEQMYLEIKEHKFNVSPIKYEERYDDVAKKVRKIGISSMKQQCYDYIAVNACKEMFLAKIGHYQCASLKNKGQLFGKTAIETWIRTNPNNCKWIFKCDIKKFYPSVKHEIIKKYIERDIKNDDMKYLIFSLIDTYDEGLCIGSYLCQFLANYFLSYAYHYVTEMLYTERRGKRLNLVHHTLFYMDDIILLGSNKKSVKMAANKLEKYLKDNLGLSLKPSYQLFPLDSRPIDMMGYKIYTYKTTVRRRIYNRANKVFVKYKNPKNQITLEGAYKVISYYGYIKHSYNKKYSKKVKLNKTLKTAKEVISNAAKKSNI